MERSTPRPLMKRLYVDNDSEELAKRFKFGDEVACGMVTSTPKWIMEREDDEDEENNTDIRPPHADLGVYTNLEFIPIYDAIRVYKARHLEAFKQFDDDIWTYFKTERQDDKLCGLKMHARYVIHEEIKKYYPDSDLTIVGSSLNGCGNSTSDLDMCLCIMDESGLCGSDRKFALHVLHTIAEKFATEWPEFLNDLELVPATVPILKLFLHEPFDQLEIDLNCNSVSGIFNTHLLHHYSRVDDRFGAMSLVLRQWAVQFNIKDTFAGTLNSLSLNLMLVHFLQCCCDPPVLPNLQFLFGEQFNGDHTLDELTLFDELPTWPKRGFNKQTVAELLIAFFQYYANFDFANDAISVFEGRVFPRADLDEFSDRFKVFIEEPFDGQNTARCVTTEENFDKIMNAFQVTKACFTGSRAPSIARFGIFTLYST